MKRYSHVTLALLPLSMAAQAYGQGNYYYPDSRPVQAQVEVGGAVPVGGTSDNFDSGATVGGGVLFHPAPGPFALRATFDYTRLDTTRQLEAAVAQANQTPIRDGELDIYSVRVNALLETQLSPYTRGYITAGIGAAYERLRFGDGFGRRYDTVYFGRRDDDDRFTWNAGAGLDFSMGGRQSLFVEAAYEHINTPQATTFVPIRVGVRF